MPLTKRDEPHTWDDHEIDLDRLSPHFRASRDAIARIIRQAKKPGHLARASKRRSVREWFRRPWPKGSEWWSEGRALRRRRWLDGNGLGDVALDGADLLGAHLEHAVLSWARLDGATLWRAHLEQAKLWKARLDHARLPFAYLEQADLPGAHLEHAELWQARLDHANLHQCGLAGARSWNQATYAGANWWDAGTEEKPLTGEQTAWFEEQEHYPREVNEPEFLKYWEKTHWGGYERREGT